MISALELVQEHQKSQGEIVEELLINEAKSGGRKVTLTPLDIGYLWATSESGSKLLKREGYKVEVPDKLSLKEGYYVKISW